MRPCPTPSDAFGTARQSGIGVDTLVLPVLRFVTCTDGSFDVILSTMVVAVSEGAFVQKQMLCWGSTSAWKWNQHRHGNCCLGVEVRNFLDAHTSLYRDPYMQIIASTIQ